MGDANYSKTCDTRLWYSHSGIFIFSYDMLMHHSDLEWQVWLRFWFWTMQRSARSVQAPVMMGPVTRREQPLGSRASSMIECLNVETAPIGTSKEESLHWPLHITVFRESSLAAMVECDTNLGHDHGRSRFAAHGELLRIIIVHCGDHGGQHLIAKDRACCNYWKKLWWQSGLNHQT